MSGRGRRASLPPADHARPGALAFDGLVVQHHNSAGRAKEYDFSTLPVAPPMQRSLAALFAARCVPHRWTSHRSSEGYWVQVNGFATYLSELEQPPGDLDGLTSALVKRWRLHRLERPGGYGAVTTMVRLLRDDPRLQSGLVADELARRVPEPKWGTQSYAQAEFDRIMTMARQAFRSALLRIEENARHLQQWSDGAFTEGTQGWLIGEALNHLAATGDVPRYRTRSKYGAGAVKRHAKALGGDRATNTWQRLFLTRHEAVSLGVLLMAEYGWNLAVIDKAEVPRATPDSGPDGRPTYRIPVEKKRRGAGRYFETRNVTDDGASSSGRLITQALAATRFARAVVEELTPGTDRLIIWRHHRPGRGIALKDGERLAPVGPFNFGVPPNAPGEWARSQGLGGSPFRRGRRTVNAIDRREPGQNSQSTHDRHYVLPDRRVQEASVTIIAAGAENAAALARRTVLVAELREEADQRDVPTATADCVDYANGPYPAPDGGCGASFLMCLGCRNARVHPGHHSRLAHLHQALANLHSILQPGEWETNWEDPFLRLGDLKNKVGAGQWAQALDRVTDADRELIDDLLTGDLDL